jgi:hypothetical protein
MDSIDSEIEEIDIEKAKGDYLDSLLFRDVKPLPPIMPAPPTYVPQINPNYLRILRFTQKHPREKGYRQWTLEQIAEIFKDTRLLNEALLLIDSYEELSHSKQMSTTPTILNGKITKLHAVMQSKWEEITAKKKTKSAISGGRRNRTKKRNAKNKTKRMKLKKNKL